MVAPFVDTDTSAAPYIVFVALKVKVALLALLVVDWLDAMASLYSTRVASS